MSDHDDETLQLPASSLAQRKVALSSRGHFCGQMVIGDPPGRIVQLESYLEFQWCLCLISRQETEHLQEQVAFGWHDEFGECHTHFFDFIVTERNGARIAYAVRPEKRTGGQFGETMPHIAQQARQSRFVSDVRVLTDGDLDPIEVFNARLLHGARAPDREADTVAREIASVMSGITTLGDLTDRLCMGARGHRALLRLMRTHHLRAVHHERLTNTTEIYKAETIP